MNEIPSNYKVCIKRTAQDCLKVGPPDGFKGKTCPKCYALYKSEYYKTNMRRLNDKVTEKRRAKREQAKMPELNEPKNPNV